MERVRGSYKSFELYTSQQLPNVNPLLVAVITQYEGSIGADDPKDVRATIRYRSGTAMQKGINESDKINAKLQKLGIKSCSGDSKTNEENVELPLSLSTLFKLSKDKRIEWIDLR